MDGKPQLKRNHDYFIQVQGQMAVCAKEYSDFVCWTDNQRYLKGIHVELSLNLSVKIKSMLDLLFKNGIPCELLTQALKDGNVIVDKENRADNSTDACCVCRKGEFGLMIACNNKWLSCGMVPLQVCWHHQEA